MAKEDTPKQELLDIRPAEISIVDLPANEEQFLIVKRQQSSGGSTVSVKADESEVDVTTTNNDEDDSLKSIKKQANILLQLAKERAEGLAAAAAKLTELVDNEGTTKADVVKQFDTIYMLLNKTEQDMLVVAKALGTEARKDLKSDLQVAIQLVSDNKAAEQVVKMLKNLVAESTAFSTEMDVVGDGDKYENVKKTLSELGLDIELLAEVQKAKKVTPKRLAQLNEMLTKLQGFVSELETNTTTQETTAPVSKSNDELLAKLSELIDSKLGEVKESVEALTVNVGEVKKAQDEIDDRLSQRGISKAATDDEVVDDDARNQLVKKSVFSDSVFTPLGSSRSNK